MSEIKIPTNAEEAHAMALLGVKWLQDNAPDQLTQHHRDIQADAGRAGYLIGIQDWRYAELKHQNFNIERSADNYAEKVRNVKQ